jgi:transposase-like protein
MNKVNLRQARGQEIVKLGNQIQRLDDTHYQVNSQSGHGVYDIILGANGWVCSCPDSMYRNVKCKHCFAVEISLSLRKAVEPRKIEPININNCIHCNSDRIVRFGIRHNKHGDIQKFQCKDCSKYFTINIGFEKMKHNPQGITTAMQLYFSGESLRKTAESLKLIGIEVSHQTVYNWIKKYISLMKEYGDKLQPNVGDTWRADEMYVKIKGDLKYLFALMDDDTRYWIAQEVADSKERHNAQYLFRTGKELMGKTPKVLITDGLPAYEKAFMWEYWTQKKPRSIHIRHITISGDRNNNKMERLNGEIRDREKVMRSLKKKDTPIITGYQIFHNYIRPHEALDGKTPAEACGIKVEGDNKWITLIQNAHQRKIY